MGPTIVANNAERLLVLVEQAIRAAERLDNHLIAQDLIQIQGIDPLRVEASQHLVHHNENIEPLLGLLLDAQMGPFVSQPVGHIGLESRPRA